MMTSMINRTDITKAISQIVETHILSRTDPRIYWAKEVTFDYGTADQGRADYVQIKPKNNSVSGIEKSDVYIYEIKSSVEDFKSKNGHNFIGDLNYYVMPESVYRELIEMGTNFGFDPVGIYTVADDFIAGSSRPKYAFPNGNGIVCVRKARRKDRKYPISMVLLMMFRSRHRDALKYEKGDCMWG